VLPDAELSYPCVVGRYTILGKIASGGMATVHLGRLAGPLGFSRTVAIKRMLPNFSGDPEFVSMFLDEARLAARIRHPNVVPTLDVVAERGELFLVMEYVQGETLARLLHRTSKAGMRIPLPVVGAIFSGALHGLHAAHEARDEHGEPLSIVHRDMSPQNIIVGNDGVARVLDFGVAKAAGQLYSTHAGELKGKIPYMAPELLKGAKPSRRSDLFSTSVVFWEALTGERLFEGPGEMALLKLVGDCNIEPPSARVQDLPPGLDDVVMRGLEKQPEQRYPTAKAMASAIEECFQVAIPSAVASWVEQIAGEAIARQAARLAQIEAGDELTHDFSDLVSIVVSDAPHLNAAPPGAPPASNAAIVVAPPETPSQISSISVSSTVGAAVHRKRLAMAVFAGLAAAAIAIAAWIWSPGSGPPAGAAPGSVASGAPSTTPPATLSVLPDPPPPPAASSTASAPAPSATVPAKKKPAGKGGVMFRNPG
jgi:eukaryotic-like serine/threonine-protein kinase